MINISDIIDAVCGVLAAAHPTRLVMVEKMAQGFQRPSFSVEHLKTTGTPAGYRLWHWQHEMAVCVYVPIDERGEWDRQALAGELSAMSGLFSGGTLTVGDRHLEVMAMPGEAGAGASALKLQFDYFDDAVYTAASVPLMQEITMESTDTVGHETALDTVHAVATDEEGE